MSWTDAIDEVLGGDQAIALAYATPADGVVLAPVTNFGVRDRAAGTVTVNSSIGMWRKLERIRRKPHVSLVFHTRRHGFSDRPEFVLVQGRAALSEPIPDYPAVLGSTWDRFDGPRATGAFWKWWLRAYYTRVEIAVAVERVLTWPDLACTGEPAVRGTPLPATEPAAQEPPARGTGPRLDAASAATRASELPDVLLGWIGADRFPVVVPVEITGGDESGMRLAAPGGAVPAGGRRAGLTAHAFTRHVLGQAQRIHTGWLEADRGTIRYAPHTRAGHRLPPVPFLYRLAVGWGTRRGIRTRPNGLRGSSS